MPANDQRHDRMSAMMPLLRMLAAWRQRRATRRGVRLHGFTNMSDRMLADIGVRRADVHAAISGMMPVEHLARTQGARHGRRRSTRCAADPRKPARRTI